jgi:signal transduction histidine kinase
LGKIHIEAIFRDANAPIGLNDTAILALYRVITELISNTLKHASAKKILIIFSATNDLYTINYQDDGIGITTEAKGTNGIGLQNIESRLGMIGATYEINYGGNNGFQISINLNV